MSSDTAIAIGLAAGAIIGGILVAYFIRGIAERDSGWLPIADQDDLPASPQGVSYEELMERSRKVRADHEERQRRIRREAERGTRQR